MKLKKPIYVTQPSLPPLKEFIPYLEKIWNSKVLTNGGHFHAKLEEALCEYLGVEHIALFSNGTAALMTALQSLQLTGEVITTPYSFLATAHSLVWNNLKPVFVDIGPGTFNIDCRKIEEAITAETSAIMPVHCYGYPCDTDAIQKIADKHNLKVIYDAAHAFGVQDNGGSVLRHGDLSILSFHATKVFNTFEGGAIICPDAESKQRIDQLKNFGLVDEVNIIAPGLNGKMSEFNAALGLLQLKYVNQSIEKRGVVDKLYREHFDKIPGITCIDNISAKAKNYSYFPILVEEAYPLSRDELYLGLKDAGIHTRRYFYPLISEFSVYNELPSSDKSNLPVASVLAEQVLCLPIYADLDALVVNEIAQLIEVQ